MDNLDIDQLSWDKFLKFSKKRGVLKKITEFNRLIFHSNNFFVVGGYGAFSPGYLLLISKDFIPSFGLIEKEKFKELNFLIKIAKKSISYEFKRSSAVFEHGMCACVGGLDRAHIHIMSLPKSTNASTLKKSIELTLFNRKSGVKYIEFKKFKLTNIHDINQLYSEGLKKNSEYKVNGKIYKLEDIQNLNFEKWPFNTFKHIKKGNHYVYFKSDFKESSFLTTNNFQTQFGREVVYNNELMLNKKFKIECDKKLKENKFLDIWKWQNHKFEKNIYETIVHIGKALGNIQKEYKNEFHQYGIKII
tara:strand:- start:110 stop:1021 length:912 start_codon:yes stop_codon:yes gene_type:complete